MAARRLLRRYVSSSEQLFDCGISCWIDASLPDVGRWGGYRQLSVLFERLGAGCIPVKNCLNSSREYEQDAPLVSKSRQIVAWEVPGLSCMERDVPRRPHFYLSSSSGFPTSVRHPPILLHRLAVCQQVPYSSAVRDGAEQEHTKVIEESTTPSEPSSSVGRLSRGEESNRTGAHIQASDSDQVTSVSHGWTRTEVLNWANGISMARLISGPVLGWMIVEGLTMPALIGLALSGASDWLDGYVARKSGVNSVLGSYLDPLADKVLIGSIALSMAFAGLLHPALVGFVVARDAALVVSGFVVRAVSLRWKWSGWGEFFNISPGGAELIRPLFISKVNTVVQLALVGTALLQPALGVEDTYSAVPILSWAVVATTSISWYAYGKQYLRRTPTKPSQSAA